MPEAWPDVFPRLSADPDRKVRSRATALAVTFGDPNARQALRGVLGDSRAPLDARREALAALLQAKDPALVATLQPLVADPGLGGPAIRALSAYDDPTTSAVLIAAYARMNPEARRDVLNTLAARKRSAHALLEAVDAGKVPRADLTADLIRQLGNLRDPSLDARIGQVWGTVRETSRDRAKLIAEYKARLKRTPARPPIPRKGGRSSPGSASSAIRFSASAARSVLISRARIGRTSTTCSQTSLIPVP